MKRFLVLLSIAFFFIESFSSCAAGRSMKRDCNGVKHVRLKNGVYI